MYDQMKKVLKIVLILLGIAIVVYIVASTYFNMRRNERLLPEFKKEVANAFDPVEAITSYDVIGTELTQIHVNMDAWRDATKDQRIQFVKDAQSAVTTAAIKAGYKMDLYSSVHIYDDNDSKIAEADSAGKVTLY